MPFNTQPPYNIQSVDDVTASRAFATWYTNNTGKTMFVVVSVFLTAPALNDTADAYGHIGAVVDISPVALVNRGGAVEISASVVMTVRPGQQYRVDAAKTGTGTYSLNSWFESY